MATYRRKERLKQARRTHVADGKMEEALDKLASFDEFQQSLLPQLQKDILSNMAPAELRSKYKSLLAGRQIMIGLTEVDSTKALSAIRDILDREEGKATERHEHKHQLEDLSDKQLESLLTSEIKSLNKVTERNKRKAESAH